MKSPILAALATVALVSAAIGEEAQVPRTGDLLFQTEGTSAFSRAISRATEGDGEISLVHVGIAVTGKGGSVMVIEASPEDGVTAVTLPDFLEGSPKVDGKPGVIVKRLECEFEAGEVVARALSHIGEPYDWWYLPDNGKMYCSELVYESFLTSGGAHIFEAQPMRFRASDGTMPPFWLELYERLGVDVPEGVPGTNPNDLFKDSRLREVFRYF